MKEKYRTRSNRKTKFILILSIIILIMAIISITAAYKVANYSGKTYNFRIITDKKTFSTNEEINFSIENLTDDMEVNWDFGDDNQSSEKEVSHLFEKSDFFNITAIIDYHKGKTTETITIEVKNQDVVESGEGITIRDLSPFRRTMVAKNVDILAGTTKPTITWEINTQRSTAQYEVDIWYLDEEDLPAYIVQDQGSVVLNTISFHYEIFPDDYKTLGNRSEIYFEWIIVEGRVSTFDMYTLVDY